MSGQRGSIRQRGATWTAYWWQHDPMTGELKQRSKGGHRTKKGAQQFLTGVLGQIQAGTWVEPTKQTFRQYVTGTWLPSKQRSVRPSTFASYSRVVELRLLPTFGAQPLAGITPGQIESFYAQLESADRLDGRGRLSGRSAQLTAVTLSMIFKDATRTGAIGRNPAQYARKPRANRPDLEVWSPEEVRTFLGSIAADPLAPLWVLAVMTGMRRGELCGLKWSNVNIDDATATIVETRIAVGGEVLSSQPKTNAGRRVVDLAPQAVTALRAHRAAQAAERLAAGVAWTDTGYVFVRPDGKPWEPGTITKRWTVAVRRAGLPPIKLHGARHGVATLMLEAGVDLDTVAKYLGHASSVITSAYYVHVRRATTRTAADRLGQIVAGG